VRLPPPASVLATTRFLGEAAFLKIAGCQLNPLVHLIRDDGPALIDELDITCHLAGLAQARAESPT
jgi:hypothetical protein